MATIRKAEERGQTKTNWLDSRHTFSFGDYQDPAYQRFQALRVINEDKIKAGTGFSSHSHQNMEIISYIIEGSLKHSDSMGHEGIIQKNEVQRMSAGSGVTHSEINAESAQTTHFYQIWIYPQKLDLEPSYEQKSFASALESGNLTLIVSPDGREGSLTIHQDAYLYLVRLNKGKSLNFNRRPERKLWIQIVSGHLQIQYDHFSAALNSGDGIAINDEKNIHVTSLEEGELMLFDLA